MQWQCREDSPVAGSMAGCGLMSPTQRSLARLRVEPCSNCVANGVIPVFMRLPDIFGLKNRVIV